MKKQIPNIITLSRLLLCVPIAILFAIGEGFQTLVMTLFIIACITDIIDGPIARALNNGQGTKLGQTLDTVADFSLVGVTALFIIPTMLLTGEHFIFPAMLSYDLSTGEPLLFWLCMGGFAYFVFSGLVGAIKHKSASMLVIHTYLMRTLAYILVIWVLLHWFVLLFDLPHCVTNGYTIFVIASIFILTTEQLLIALLLKGPKSDIRTILHVRRENMRIIREKQASQVEK